VGYPTWPAKKGSDALKLEWEDASPLEARPIMMTLQKN